MGRGSVLPVSQMNNARMRRIRREFAHQIIDVSVVEARIVVLVRVVRMVFVFRLVLPLRLAKRV
jgi:hypothetical protein